MFIPVNSSLMLRPVMQYDGLGMILHTSTLVTNAIRGIPFVPKAYKSRPYPASKLEATSKALTFSTLRAHPAIYSIAVEKK